MTEDDQELKGFCFLSFSGNFLFFMSTYLTKFQIKTHSWSSLLQYFISFLRRVISVGQPSGRLTGAFRLYNYFSSLCTAKSTKQPIMFVVQVTCGPGGEGLEDQQVVLLV